MNMKHRLMIAVAMAIALIAIGSRAAMVRAEDAEAPAQAPMQSHDFTDVPVATKEWMEPFINDFYHQGITGGCSAAPLKYCPEDNVTRAEMAVFIGRALGYRQAVVDGYTTEAYFKSTGSGYGAIGRSTTNGVGVLGVASTGGYGVWGLNSSGVGVLGQSGNSYGLWGYSTNNYAVVAQSVNANGLWAEAGPESFFDAFFDVVLNDYGEILAETTLDLYANADVVVDLDNDNNGANAYRIYNGSDSQVFFVDEAGNTHSAGNTSAGGSKSAVVETEAHGTRLMYSVEATEVLFEDIGSAQLVDGEVIVTFDAIFAETVNLSEDYQVFLTPVGGWAELYIAEKTDTHFVVRSADGTSNLQFDFRIIAKRLGYENVRTEPMNAVPERPNPEQ